MKTYFSEKPNAIQFMTLPDKITSDVWLRKNITKETGTNTESEEVTTYEYYTADEVYFRTQLSYDYIEQNFEQVYEEMSKIVPITPVEIPITERIEVLESAVAELAEVLSNG